MVQLGQQLGRGAVGEMPARARDPPLHHRRIAAGAEQDLVVVGLQHDRRELPQQIAHGGGGPAEIVGHPDAGPVAAPRPRPPAAPPHRGWWGRRSTRNGPELHAADRAPGRDARSSPIRGSSRPRCPAAVSTGTPSRRASRAAPQAWSPCSWVSTMPPTRSSASPASAARRSISRALNPASISSAAPVELHRAAVPPRARAQHEERAHPRVPRAVGPPQRLARALGPRRRSGGPAPARRRARKPSSRHPLAPPPAPGKRRNVLGRRGAPNTFAPGRDRPCPWPAWCRSRSSRGRRRGCRG